MSLGIRVFFALLSLLYLVFQQKYALIAKTPQCYQHGGVFVEAREGAKGSPNPNTDKSKQKHLNGKPSSVKGSLRCAHISTALRQV
jgi:hypothetical protein